MYSFKPTGPNQQWHSDGDVRLGRLSALLSAVVCRQRDTDRYVVHHRLLLEPTGRAVAVELEATLSKCKGVRPRIVHDHGGEFCNGELRTVVKAHDLLDIRTRTGIRSRTESSSTLTER